MNQLNFFDLILSLILIGIALGIASWQKLGLSSQIIIATGRSLVQLLAVAYVLDFIFIFNNPWLVLITVGVMSVIAAVFINSHLGKKLRGLFLIIWGAILTAIAVILCYTTILIVQPDTWYQPQYLIPITAMNLANAINASPITGGRLVSAINNNRLEIETHLSLGATPQQAITAYHREAIRAGLIPTLNQMTVIAMATIPAFFSGQLLAGVDPLNAASYEILLLFMQILVNLIVTSLITQGIYRRFFNQNWQLVN
ncbi:MAG: iron export ABC transporter permease subunit FetB [Spirulinaceae cyanobacterium]